MNNEKIEIPFGAKDSELCGFEYTIPEGFEAEIKDGKVIMRKKDSDDERIRKMLIEQMKNWRRMAAENCVSEDIKDANAALDWLENHTYPNHLIEDFLLYVLSYGKGGWGEEKQKEENDKRLERVEQLCKRIQELDAKIKSLRRKIYGDEQKDSRQKMVLENPLTGEKVYEREIPECMKCMMGGDPKDAEAIIHLAAKGWTVIAPGKEQKPAEWSENDKKCLQALIDFIGSEQNNMQEDGKKKAIAWLSSLPWRFNLYSDQVPASDDREILGEIIKFLNSEGKSSWAQWLYYSNYTQDSLSKMYDDGYNNGVADTKKRAWKPSEDQMKLLFEAQKALLGKDCHNRFTDFVYELKRVFKK